MDGMVKLQALQFLVIQDEFRNHSFVNFSRWKLILRVFDYHSSQLCEVFGNFWRAIIHYEKIMTSELFQELSVVVDVVNKRFRLKFSGELLLLLHLLLIMTSLNIILIHA